MLCRFSLLLLTCVHQEHVMKKVIFICESVIFDIHQYTISQSVLQWLIIPNNMVFDPELLRCLNTSLYCDCTALAHVMQSSLGDSRRGKGLCPFTLLSSPSLSLSASCCCCRFCLRRHILPDHRRTSCCQLGSEGMPPPPLIQAAQWEEKSLYITVCVTTHSCFLEISNPALCTRFWQESENFHDFIFIFSFGSSSLQPAQTQEAPICVTVLL